MNNIYRLYEKSINKNTKKYLTILIFGLFIIISALSFTGIKKKVDIHYLLNSMTLMDLSKVQV